MKGLKLIIAAIFGLVFNTLSVAEEQVNFPADVRVLIDVSGSMKQNDPNNLRQSSLQLLVNLLPTGSKAGVWTFGQWVNMAIKLQPVDDNWRQMAIAESKNIASHGLYTNIGGAMDQASYDFGYSYFDTNKTPVSVILLTDGMVDISKRNDEDAIERSRILGQLLDKYRAKGVIIHTIALSDQADKELLQTLASESGGQFAIAENAEELSRIFLQTLTNITPSTEVAITNNQFNIDSSVNEFTALIFRREGAAATRLKSPSNKEVSASNTGNGVRWYSGKDYDLITITQPETGSWTILADEDEANKVSIVSNLTLSLNAIPGQIDQTKQTTLTLDVLQQKALVKDENFLALIDVSLLIKNIETDEINTVLPVSRKAGRYSFELPTQETGKYTAQARLSAPTFDRQIITQYSVHALFTPQINFDPESTQLTVLVSPNSNKLDMASVRYNVSVEPAINEANTMDSADGWLWQANLETLGDYTITVVVEGSFNDGKTFAVDLLSTELSSPGIAPIEPTKPVVQTPPPAPKNDEILGFPRKQFIYVGIGLVNLLVILIGYMIYRRYNQGKTVEDETPMAEKLEQKTPVAEPVINDLSSLHAVDIDDSEPEIQQPTEMPSFDELFSDELEEVEESDDIESLVAAAEAELAQEDEVSPEKVAIEEEQADIEIPEYFSDAVEEDVVEEMAKDQNSNDEFGEDDIDLDDLLSDVDLAELEKEGEALNEDRSALLLSDDFDIDELAVAEEESSDVFADEVIEEEAPLVSEFASDEMLLEDVLEDEIEDSDEKEITDLEAEFNADLNDETLDEIVLEETAEDFEDVAEVKMAEESVDADDDFEEGEHDALLDNEFTDLDDNEVTDEIESELEINELDPLNIEESLEDDVDLSELDAFESDELNDMQIEALDVASDIDKEILADEIETSIDEDLYEDIPVLEDEVDEETLAKELEQNDILPIIDDLDDLSFSKDTFKPAEKVAKPTDFSALDDLDLDSALDDLLQVETAETADLVDLDDILGDLSLEEDAADDDLVDLSEEELPNLEVNAEHIEEPEQALQDIVDNDLSLDDLADIDLGADESLDDFGDLGDLDDLDSLLEDLDDEEKTKR